jgi:hypothetical protein
MKWISQRLPDFARHPDDSPDDAFSKWLVVIVALNCCACGLVWSAMYYVVFGFGITVILPLGFVLIVGTAAIISDRIADHRPLIYAQIACITWISALIQWSIGSMEHSGLVILVFPGAHRCADFFKRQAGSDLDGHVPGNRGRFGGFRTRAFRPLTVSDQTRIFFYIMNIGASGLVVFAASAWFVSLHN